MRAYSCIDSLGRWTDPPTQVNFSSAPAAGTERKIQPARSFDSGAQPVSASHQLSRAIDVIQPRSLPVAPSISQREVNSGADDGSEIQIDSDHAFESEADRGNENHLEPAIEGDRVSGSETDPETDPELEIDPDSGLTPDDAITVDRMYRTAIRLALTR